jgi:hypothetical protein
MITDTGTKILTIGHNMPNYVSTTAFDDQYTIESATISVAEAAQNSLTMIAGGCEMLRVAQDGFYVRGQKVPADDREAEIVYNAFKQFLTWAELNRR